MPRRHHFHATIVLALCTIPAAAPAWAAYPGPLDPPAGPIAPTPGPEARIAINDANTPGDTFNLFRITAPGSYYLTGNLTGLHSRNCIQIAASNVTLDLNGFTLVGASSSLAGVIATSGLSNVCVRNGAVTGWDAHGVDLQGVTANAVVENLRAGNISGSGVIIGPNGVVRACAVNDCSQAGIAISGNGVVVDCTTANNAVGVSTGLAATVTRCSARDNFVHGIIVGDNSVVSACASYNNGGMGFLLFSGCIIDRCTSIANGDEGIFSSFTCAITACVVGGNHSNGIHVTGGSLVQNCVCAGNGNPELTQNAGIYMTGPDNRIDSNTCNSNFVGIKADKAGNLIVRNACSNSAAANWSIIEGNRCFVQVAPDSGFIDGDSGGVPLGSSDPNANFTY